jgi:hypothetical protein
MDLKRMMFQIVIYLQMKELVDELMVVFWDVLE